MSELLALGVSHKTAPVALRERLALTEAGAEPLLRELVGDPSDRARRSRSPPATAPSSTSSSATRSRPRAPCSALLARRAGIRPTELVGGDLLAAQLRRRAPPLPRRPRARVDDRRRGRDPGPGQARLRARRSPAQSTGPLTNRLFRAALATGKRVRTETAIAAGRASASRRSPSTPRATRSATSARATSLIIGAGETGELTARALHEQGVRDDLRRQPPRDRALALAAALRRRRRLASTRCPTSSSGPTSWSPRPPRRTRSSAPRSSALVMPSARRAAAAADRPRRAARHRPGVRASSTASRCYDIDDLQAQVARNLRVRARRGARAPRRSSRRRSSASPAGWARSRCCRRSTALRERGDDDRRAGAGRERGPLGVAERRATASASRRSPARDRQPAAARADAAPAAQLDAEHRHARLQLLRELFGLDDGGGGRAPAERRRGPPAAAPRRELTPLRVGTRGQRAGAGPGALRSPSGCRRASRSSRSPPRATRRARRRQVALGRRARGRAAGGRDRPRRALRQGRAGRAGRRAASWCAAPRRARIPRDALGGADVARRRCREGARVGHQRAAPPRAAARGAARPRGRASCAATSTRGCASCDDGRGRRDRARRRRARAARARERGRRRLLDELRARARPGRARARGARRATIAATRGRDR